MAAPVDSARVGTNIATAATSHNINVGSPVAGTLLIVMVRFAGAPGTVTFTGYTQFAADTSDNSDDDTRIYYRWADGSEGATDTLTTSNSIKLAAISWEITGAANPATTEPGVGSVAIGTAANINPPSGGLGTVVGVGASISALPVNGGTGTNEQQAQSFVASGTTVSRVGFFVAKISSPTDDLVLEIQSDSSGSPSGTALGTAATVPASTGPFQYQEYDCSIAGLAVGATYWLVARRTGARDSTNYLAVRTSDVGFAAGEAKTRSSGSWSSVSGFDWQLLIRHGDAKDFLFLTVIGLDSETATATAPSGYGNTVSANSGTGGAVATNCMIWGASKQATAAADDPAAWTSSAPASGVTAWTIAIAPAAPVGPVTVERSAALNAVGAIATVGRETLLRTGALNAVGAVASAGIFWTILERAFAASATAAIQTAGEVTGGAEEVERAAAVDATAAIATSGRSVISRSAAVNATAAIVSVGQEGLARAAALTATGAIGSSGIKIAPRQAMVDAAAAVTSSGEVTGAPETITGQASLPAAATVAAAGTVTSPQTVTAAAHLDAVGTITVTIGGGAPPPALVGALLPQQPKRVVEAAAHIHATARIETDNPWIPKPLSPVVFTRTAAVTATATVGVSARPIRIRTATATLAATAITTGTGKHWSYVTGAAQFRIRTSVLATGTTIRHGQARLDGDVHMRTNWDTPLTQRKRDEELLLLLIGGDDL